MGLCHSFNELTYDLKADRSDQGAGVVERTCHALAIDDEFLDMIWSHYLSCIERYGVHHDGDDNKPKQCTTDQLIHYFGLRRTPLTLHLFSMYSPNRNAFRDDHVPFWCFLVAMWEVLTRGDDLYDCVHMLYSIFDLDTSGKLLGDEVYFVLGIFFHGHEVPAYVNKKLGQVLPLSKAESYEESWLIERLENDESLLIPLQEAMRRLRKRVNVHNIKGFFERRRMQRRGQFGLLSAADIISMPVNFLKMLGDLKRVHGMYKGNIQYPDRYNDIILTTFKGGKGEYADDARGGKKKKSTEEKRDRENERKRKNKLKYMGQQAAMAASKVARRLSRRLNNVSLDPSLDEAIRKIKKNEADMRRRDSAIGSLQWMGAPQKQNKNGAKAREKKSGPGVYTRIHNHNEVSAEVQLYHNFNMKDKSGITKKQLIVSGDAYVAPVEGDDDEAPLMTGKIVGGGTGRGQ
jgi:hypothetical protein